MELNANMAVRRGTGPLGIRGTGPLAPLDPTADPTAPTPRSAPPSATELGTRNLTNALIAFFGAMTPPAQALFDLFTGGLTTPTTQMLQARGVGIDELKASALAFAPMLQGFAPVGQILGSGALSWLNQAKGLDDLQRTPENEARAGTAIVDQLAGALFPDPSQTSLRQGATELLTHGALDPDTAGRLGPDGLQQLGDRLDQSRDLIGQVAPPESTPPLNSMLHAVAIAASTDQPTGSTVTSAAQTALPTGMQGHTFDAGGMAAGSFSVGKPGVAALSGSGDASASIHAEATVHGTAGIDDNGLYAEGGVKASVSAKVEANGHLDADTPLSHTHVDAHADASVSAEAEAEGSLGVGADGVHAQAHVGAAVKAEANADADEDTSLFGGAIHDHTHVEGHAIAEASAEASARANVGFDQDGHFELDAGFDAHARAVAQAKGMVEKDVNIFGFKLGVEGYATAQAGAEAGVSGWLTYKDGELHIGGGIGAALGLGAEFGGGIVIGLPPFLRDAVDGVAKVASGVVGTVKDMVGGIGDALGSLFGGGDSATPSALPPLTFSEFDNWFKDLADDGSGSPGQAFA